MSEKTSQFSYAGAWIRGCAASIDIMVATTLRIVTAMILGNLWFNQQLANFIVDMKSKFGTDMIGHDPERIDFLLHHPILKAAILFYLVVFLVGALYHILLNSSRWQGTIGKRIMKLTLVKNDGSKLTFWTGTAHYFLSIVPWIFVLYITAYQALHNVTIYNAISDNAFNLVFGLATLAWLEIHLIIKKKTTAQDMICHTVMIKDNG